MFCHDFIPNKTSLQTNKWRSLTTPWLKASFSWQSHHRVRELIICIHCAVNLFLCYKTIQNLAAYRDNHFIVYPDVMGRKFRLGLAGCFFCSLQYWRNITWWYSTLRWVLEAGGVHNNFTVLWLDVDDRKGGLSWIFQHKLPRDSVRESGTLVWRLVVPKKSV